MATEGLCLEQEASAPGGRPLSPGWTTEDLGAARSKGFFPAAVRKSQPRTPTSWENQLISPTAPAPSPHFSAWAAPLRAAVPLPLLLGKRGVGGSLIQPPFCSSSCWKDGTSVRSSRWEETKWHDNSYLDDREQHMGLLKFSQGRPSLTLSSELLRTCCTYLQNLHFAFWRQTLKCNTRWKSQACWEPIWVFTSSDKTLSVPPFTLLPGTYKITHHSAEIN